MRVCIIGAGAAGLGAAYYLNQQGITDVTIFEALDRVGGKCYTLQDEGQAYDMGAIEVTPAYIETLALIERFGLGDTLVPIPDAVVIDRQNGEVTPFSSSLYTPAELQQLPGQLAIFLHNLLSPDLYPWMIRPGLHDAPPRIRGRSFDEWLNEIGAPLVARIFWVYIFCFGYGYVEKIPALYAIKFCSVINFAATMRRINMSEYLPRFMRDAITPTTTVLLRNGYGDLMNRVHDSLAQPAALQTKVKRVWRENDQVRVKYSTKFDSAEKEQSFDYLIVAVPQTEDSLKFLDLTSTEQSLFSKVFTTTYATTLQRPKSFEFLHYTELRADGVPGEAPIPAPVQFAQIWDNQSSDMIFYTDTGRDVVPEAQIEKLVRENMKTMGYAEGKNVATQVWRYFPRADTPDLFPGFNPSDPAPDRSGDFYNVLDGIQGENRTFYCGGLLNFELVETTLRYSHAIADRIANAANST
ncbi:MAG: FAD-dependent oxidoreductase [bacterium]|nr:FAD-dependent oxidoreductase [bacterium]